jgi:transposase-like protein
VAQAEGVNSHPVFQWRRAYRLGELVDFGEPTSSLLPVTISSSEREDLVSAQRVASEARPASGGAIRVELPGGTTISVESGVDPATLRVVLESLRK